MKCTLCIQKTFNLPSAWHNTTEILTWSCFQFLVSRGSRLSIASRSILLELDRSKYPSSIPINRSVDSAEQIIARSEVFQQQAPSALLTGRRAVWLVGAMSEGRFALQDWDEEVPTSASRLQETRVDALGLALDQVKHLLDSHGGVNTSSWSTTRFLDLIRFIVLARPLAHCIGIHTIR
jgi:hypothetical protein